MKTWNAGIFRVLVIDENTGTRQKLVDRYSQEIEKTEKPKRFRSRIHRARNMPDAMRRIWYPIDLIVCTKEFMDANKNEFNHWLCNRQEAVRYCPVTDVCR